MPAETFLLPFRPALDPNGLTVSGAELYFFASGTSTPQPVYADDALTILLQHPVMANAAGKWPTINLDATLVYRVVLRGQSGPEEGDLGEVLAEADPYVVNVTDPLEADLQAFVNAAAAQAVNAGTEAGNAATQATAAGEQASAAATSAGNASDFATAAEYAAQQAGMYSAMYPNTAAGLAGTAEGEYFSVPDTDDAYAILYQNVSGVAVEINRYPALSQVEAKAQAEALGTTGAATDMGEFDSPLLPNNVSAKAVLEGLVEGLAAPPGGAAIGLTQGGTVQEAANAIEPSVWRRTPVADTGLRYPNYSADLVVLGGTFLYPQSFDFDDEGNIYLNTTSETNSEGISVIVVYDSSFNYRRRFFRPTVGSESIVVTGSPSLGTLKLYFAISGNLVEYAPGTLPADGSTMAAGATRISGGCGSIFNFNEGKWLILQLTVDLGTESSRTAFNFYDAGFNHTGRFFVAKNVVGWQTAVNAGYPYVPKMQGITHRDGKVYISVGGSYIPASEPGGPLRAADYGLIEVSADGSVLQYGVCDADLFLNKIAGMGYSIERTENEGVTVGPDGSIYTLLVTKRPATADADVTGLVLLKEMDMLGARWDDIPSPYKPNNLARYSGRVWPRSSDNKMRHPVSNAEITTVAGLLDLMVDMQLPDASYFSAVNLLTPVTDMTYMGESWRVDIFNLNNQTFHCRMTSTTSRVQQWHLLSGGAGAWAAGRLSTQTQVLYIWDGVGSPAVRTGYAGLFVDFADGDLKVKFADGTVKTIVTDT